MKRDRFKDLELWKDSLYRKPLLIRGCRQVGKSWLIREFGKQFELFVEINFEKNKGALELFSGDLTVHKLIEKLSLYMQTKIVPGKTLLFLDEIQICEGALQALRYFKEDLPELHVIAAGSLLDFALHKLGIAVGRVQFLHLYPLSFAEYLTVLDRDDLRNFLFQQENDQVIGRQLMEYLKEYLWLGGMPAVVEAWLMHKDPILCQKIQDEIIESYQIDFYKYAKQHQVTKVTQVFEAIPSMLGKKFIYSRVDENTRAEIIKDALKLLELAGIAIPCYHTSAQGMPLGAMTNDKKFKIFFFDTGIAQRLLGLDIQQWMINPLRLSNQGEIIEQFVAQELLAYADFHQQAKLYYWHREARNSNAEVDFIILKQGQVIPVEVKSAHEGSMKSMNLFLDSHLNTPYGLKISMSGFAKHNRLVEIPLYAIESWIHPS